MEAEKPAPIIYSPAAALNLFNNLMLGLTFKLNYARLTKVL